LVPLIAALVACVAPAFRAGGAAAPAAQDARAEALREVWKETWADLEKLGTLSPGSAERDRLVRELDGFQVRHERNADKARDREEKLRARILRAHLVRLSSGVLRPVPEPGPGAELLPAEAWIALQVLGPGPTRGRAVADALASARGEALRARAEVALDAAAEDARGLHLDWALAETRSVHEKSPGARSAAMFAAVLRLRGEYDAALSVLDPAIATAPDGEERAALRFERAAVRAAAGSGEEATADLGGALAAGSVAAARRLGLRALEAGLASRARAMFRPAAFERPPTPLAARGYGLALLSCAGPSPDAPCNPQDAVR